MTEFQGFPKIDRYYSETFTITEKIDGTNACLIFEGGRLTCQSRKRIIKPGDDNFGFAGWAHAHTQELYDLFGEGRHFGEWWGLGIQRGYGLQHRAFSPFNSHAWPNDKEAVMVGGVPVKGVPTICNLPIQRLASALIEAHRRLEDDGSVAAPGFMNPEGCMLYFHQLGKYLKAPLDATPKWAAAAAATMAAAT